MKSGWYFIDSSGVLKTAKEFDEHFRGFKENYFKTPANNSNIPVNRLNPGE